MWWAGSSLGLPFRSFQHTWLEGPQDPAPLAVVWCPYPFFVPHFSDGNLPRPTMIVFRPAHYFRLACA